MGASAAVTDERPSVEELEDLAFELRRKLLHLCGTYEGAVHIGGDLSAADIFTVLFHYGLHVDPTDIANPERDRFVLSKGHAAVCMYIAMAMRGFFSYEGIVDTYGQLDSAYGMHPCKVQLPGVECSTGSLGHGLPLAVGMALSARGRGETHRVVTLLGETFEVLNRYEEALINTAAQAMEYAELSGSAALGIHLDTFHMAVEEADMAAAIRHALPRLRYLELGQSGRGPLQTGALDLARAVRQALDDGYTGRIGVEAFSRPLTGPAADVLAIWRTTFDDGLVLAADAERVIRAGWTDSVPGRRAQRLARSAG